MDALSDSIKKLIFEIVDRGLIPLHEFDYRIINCIKALSENESLHILENFLANDLLSVECKEKYLYESFLDHIKTLKDAENLYIVVTGEANDISNRVTITELLNRTRYSLALSNGQRRYGGPPPYWGTVSPECCDPENCTQVYIGKLDKYVFEDTLVPFVEKYGRIYQLRIMVHYVSGENRGYAFVDFFTKKEAKKFIEECDDKPFLHYGPIIAKLSIPCCRLLISGITIIRSKCEVEEEIKRHFPCIKSAIAVIDEKDTNKNTGQAYAVFNNHHDANQARKKMMTGKVLIFNQFVKDVEWTDSEFKTEGSSSDHRRKLYVRYCVPSINEDMLRNIFSPFGAISKIDIVADFAFVEFEKAESAQNAKNNLDNKEINGNIVHVSWAKSKVNTVNKRRERRQYPRNSYDRIQNFDDQFENINQSRNNVPYRYDQNVRYPSQSSSNRYFERIPEVRNVDNISSRMSNNQRDPFYYQYQDEMPVSNNYYDRNYEERYTNSRRQQYQRETNNRANCNNYNNYYQPTVLDNKQNIDPRMNIEVVDPLSAYHFFPTASENNGYESIPSDYYHPYYAIGMDINNNSYPVTNSNENDLNKLNDQ